MTKSSSPEGLPLGNPRKPGWKVGKLLGEGAFASVYQVTTQADEPTGFVAKITPVPKKETKKRTSKLEINYRKLHHEQVLYQCQFQEIQGSVVPRVPTSLPNEPPGSSEVGGYFMLVMERMECTLWDAIPSLLDAPGSTVQVGPIATRLVDCFQAIHDQLHVVVDVKPDNLMLAYDDSSQKKAKKAKQSAVKSEESASMASRIRVIDFGLSYPFKTVTGHQPDDGVSQVPGTPLYASLNVHDGHTPSRRDDMESLGYVVAELLCRIFAHVNGDPTQFEDGASNPTYLPWSGGSSDKEVGDIKRSEVTKAGSQFFRRMGGGNQAKIMQRYFKEVHQYKYKEPPEYDVLRDILARLEIPRQSTTTRKSRSSRVQAAKDNSKNKDYIKRASLGHASPQPVCRSGKSEEKTSGEVCPTCGSCSGMKRGTPARASGKEGASRKSGRCSNLENDPDMINSQGEEAADEMMDWEPEPDENARPTRKLRSHKKDRKEEEVKKPKTKKEKVTGHAMEVSIIEGPYSGHSFYLTEDSDSFIVGSAPTRKGIPMELPDDKSVEANHARLELLVKRFAGGTKAMLTAKVTDQKTESGTFVNKKLVPSGKDKQVFAGDKVQIGETVMILKLA